MKQTLCANLNTYIFYIILLIAEGWALPLVKTMCQHRKSELLYFLSVLSPGVSLPYGSSDVELCDCRGSIHIVPWVPALGRTIFIAHPAGAWASVKLNHFLMWGIFTSLETWLFNSKTSWYLSMAWRRSSIFGEGCTAWEPSLKILLCGEIVYNLIFLLSGNNSEFGRGESQKKVVRVGECIWYIYQDYSAIVLIYCLGRAKINCLKWEKNKCSGLKLPLMHLETRNEAESGLCVIQGTCFESGAEFLGYVHS